LTGILNLNSVAEYAFDEETKIKRDPVDDGIAAVIEKLKETKIKRDPVDGGIADVIEKLEEMKELEGLEGRRQRLRGV
jgi:hypothetical protein